MCHTEQYGNRLSIHTVVLCWRQRSIYPGREAEKVNAKFGGRRQGRVSGDVDGAEPMVESLKHQMGAMRFRGCSSGRWVILARIGAGAEVDVLLVSVGVRGGRGARLARLRCSTCTGSVSPSVSLPRIALVAPRLAMGFQRWDSSFLSLPWSLLLYPLSLRRLPSSSFLAPCSLFGVFRRYPCNVLLLERSKNSRFTTKAQSQDKYGW